MSLRDHLACSLLGTDDDRKALPKRARPVEDDPGPYRATSEQTVTAAIMTVLRDRPRSTRDVAIAIARAGVMVEEPGVRAHLRGLAKNGIVEVMQARDCKTRATLYALATREGA